MSITLNSKFKITSVIRVAGNTLYPTWRNDMYKINVDTLGVFISEKDLWLNFIGCTLEGCYSSTSRGYSWLNGDPKIVISNNNFPASFPIRSDYIPSIDFIRENIGRFDAFQRVNLLIYHVNIVAPEKYVPTNNSWKYEMQEVYTSKGKFIDNLVGNKFGYLNASPGFNWSKYIKHNAIEIEVNIIYHEENYWINHL